MTLIKEPGQDVDAFGDRVVELCRRISGIGAETDDVSAIVATTLLEYDVLALKLKALDLHGRVDDDTTAFTWTSIVSSLQEKYRSLKRQHL